jgi:stalled ribosome alternative rescue factor ArfA
MASKTNIMEQVPKNHNKNKKGKACYKREMDFQIN